LCSTMLNLASSYFVQAQNSSTIQNNIHNIYIPTTISKRAQEELKNLKPLPTMIKSPKPDDFAAWKKADLQSNSKDLVRSQKIIDLYKPNTTYKKIGGVNVVDIKPKNWSNNGKILVYLHGGGYTQLSANSTVGNAVLVSNATGLRVISIDYTTAPFSKWNHTTDQVLNVIRDLKDRQGYPLHNIAVFGESAGGGLALGSVLKMRDRGIGMPAAIVVLSPWTDLTLNGDTYFTLKDDDPILTNPESMRDYAAAYANASDQKIPYVSPVYGNFSKGFPSTLIQVGTKEVSLSDSVRLYQALDQSHIPVKLDVYEGMPHVFSTTLYDTPESKIALSKMNNFLKVYLK
ncbi:MAG: alpha/beta hydrolase, partial [Candidatus Nitrosopolaris sp.]